MLTKQRRVAVGQRDQIAISLAVFVPLYVVLAVVDLLLMLRYARRT